MVDHCSTVLAGTDRLPRGARAEFLRKPRAHYRRYRAPGRRRPLHARLRHLLVRTGRLPHVPRRCGCASALRRHVTRLVTVALPGRVRSTALRLHYRVQRRLPLRADRAVFAVYWGRGYGCNPGALEAAFRTFAPAHAHGVDRAPRAPSHAPDRDRAGCAPARPRTGRRWPAPSTW